MQQQTNKESSVTVDEGYWNWPMRYDWVLKPKQMKQIIVNNPQGGRSATKRTKTDQWCVQAKTNRVQTNATNAKNPRWRRGLTKRTEADQWGWVQTKTNLAQGSTNQPAPNGGQQEMRGGDKIKSGSGSRVRRSFQANREVKARAAHMPSFLKRIQKVFFF